MKRFTLLIIALCLFSVASWAQVMTIANKKHTLTGNVSEVAPYSTGIIYISNDGANDVVSYTTDGVTFTDVESLETGTATGLSGWVDSDMAFYLGNNTSDGVGVEIRKFDGTSAGYFFNHNPLDDPNQGLVTSVGRYYNGSSYEYHYLYQTGVDMFQAPQIVPSYTDGMDSYELSASEFGAQGPSINTGMMFNATFNGNLYYAAQKVSMLGSVAGLYTLNSGAGSMDLVYESDDPWSSIYGLTPTSQNLYFYKGNYGDQDVAAIFSMDASNNTTKISSDGGSDINFDDAHELQVLNDKVYAVVLYDFIDNQQILKLAEINGTSVRYFHLNAERESDNITDIVVSGNYVYVLAAKTDGNTQLYAINPALAEPVYAESSSLSNDMGAPRDLTAIDGGVAFVSNNGASDVVYISDGNDGNTNSLMTGGATLAVTEMMSTGSKLYFFSENGTDTEIWEHMVMPFATKTVTVTVVEKETQAPFANAQVTFDTGLETYTGTTDANGQVVLDNVPFGWLDAMVDVPSGYADIKKQQYIGAYSQDPTYEIAVASSFAFIVYDADIYDPNYVGFGSNGELGEALVVLTEGTNTYSATTTLEVNSEGFADFSDIPHGTYDYTVSRDGYVSESGTFTVNENTMEGEKVALNPCRFAVRVKNSTVPELDEIYIIPANVELTDVNDASNTHSTTIESDPRTMVIINDVFEKLPFGTYNVTVAADGFVTNTTQLVIDESINNTMQIFLIDPVPTSIEKPSNSSLSIYPNPAVDFIVFESVNAIQSVEIYSVNGAKVKALNNNKITQINISELPKGLYLVATTDSNGQRQITKINKR